MSGLDKREEKGLTQSRRRRIKPARPLFDILVVLGAAAALLLATLLPPEVLLRRSGQKPLWAGEPGSRYKDPGEDLPLDFPYWEVSPAPQLQLPDVDGPKTLCVSMSGSANFSLPHDADNEKVKERVETFIGEVEAYVDRWSQLNILDKAEAIGGAKELAIKLEGWKNKITADLAELKKTITAIEASPCLSWPMEGYYEITFPETE